MKKVLLFSGIALAAGGLYLYFKKQVDLALDYEYKIKSLRIDKIEGNLATVSVVMELRNKSSFTLTVSEYNIDLFFKGTPFANTRSIVPVNVLPQTAFDFPATGVIDLGKVTGKIMPFIQDVLNRRPIDIEVSGYVRVIFMKIPSTIDFNMEKVNYSMDLLKDYHLDTDFEKLRAKFPKLFSLLKINK